MRMRTDRFIFKTIALMFLLVVFAGCAETNMMVKDDIQPVGSDTAIIQSVQVASDGARVDVSADKPLTYTFYKTSEPLTAVIDLAQTTPGNIRQPLEVNSGNIKNISITRHDIGGGVLSRIEISLMKDEDFSVTADPADKSRLQIVFQKSSSENAAAVGESKESAAATKVAEKSVIVAESQAKPGESTATAGTGASDEKKEGLGAKESTPTAAAPGEAETKLSQLQSRVRDEKEIRVASELRNQGRSGDRIVTAVNVVRDGVEIDVTGGVDLFNTFMLTNPRRLVVDIFSAKSTLATKVVPVNSFGFGKARIGLSPDKVRIVFDALGAAVPSYQVNKSEKGLKVVFNGAPVAVPETAIKETKVAQRPDTKKKVRSVTGTVEAIDFKINEGYSRIAIKVSGECSAASPVKTAEGLALTIKNCQIPRNLQRMIDTSSFAAAVKGITPYQVRMKHGYDSKFLVKLRGEAPYKIDREGDTIIWDIKNPAVAQESSPRVAETVKPQPTVPPVAMKSARQETAERVGAEMEKQLVGVPKSLSKKTYTGRRVSLEFSDADIRKIFQLIAEVSTLNFLIADDVTGTISLKLINVPWDQALDIILESKNLDKKQEGNILYIKPKGKFVTLEQEAIEAKRVRERSMELQTHVFEVSFASIGKVATQFDALKSERGRIIQDPRTNQVIVKDIEPKLQEMAELLKRIDTPEKQVMIEARIVEATSTFTRDLGIQWGIHYKDGSASFLGINQLDTGFGGVLTSTPPASGFQAFDTAGSSMGVSFGKLTSNIQVDMRLSAAATAGLVKIISTPKVVTLNNKAAKISQGQMIPYSTVSAEGTKTEFIEAALTLEVTPHITPDGSIGMKIKASNNSAGASAPGTAPPINKKEATTELLVKNGETTVIGGIFVDTDTENDSGVPFLMDIPLFGWLFKSNSKSKNKTELLIFITPKVVT